VVVTDKEHVANQAALHFGQYALVVPDMAKQPLDALVAAGQAFAAEKGLWSGEGTYALLHGAHGADADGAPVLRLVETAPHLRQLDPSFSTKRWSMSV
jgi:pyruvate kinase